LGTWPSGVNRNKFIIAAQKRKWPGEKDSIVIIYIGTLNYERNLMALCRAVIEANNIGMDFVLWLYGDGTEKEDLKAFADQSDGQVKVYEVIPNERMPEVLARAHVGALPFPDEEKYRVSSPIKLFEYMGAGMPILATKIVCHTDVMGNGNYVFWADDSDVKGLLKGLQKTWQARTRLEALGKEALLASKDWTWAASAKRLDAALKYGLSSQSH
jgi:glycosyltransferase involved in cell wall biosynthesis